MILKVGKKIKKFSIIKGVETLNKELLELPCKLDCFKFVSFGGFSSVCFIAAIAEKTIIDNLYISTSRVGKKEILLLDKLYRDGRLGCVKFVFCGLMEQDKYPYYRILEAVCNKNGWSFVGKRNHSKVFLFDTKIGKFVLETSSNLNENPKIEQFSLENDSELFEFYKKYIFGADFDG